MKACVLTIGDEILIGQIVNTNAAWIGSELTALGVEVAMSLTVGDQMPSMLKALDMAHDCADIVIITGGLGPTHDDITKFALARYFNAELKMNTAVLEQVESRYRRRNVIMPPSNRGQAMVPEGFEAVMNSAGTAPALICERDNKLIVALPGVPHEMKIFMRENVLPRLIQRGNMGIRVQKTLLAVGIGESSLQQLLDGLEHQLDAKTSLAYLPNLQTLRLRITSVGADAADRVAQLEQWIRERAHPYLYGEGEETLEEVIGKLLLHREWTISVAESCTGGLIASTLTNTPGSSAYFVGGIVAYDNRIKESALSVNASTLNEHGAVSRQTACEMAEGVRKAMGSQIGLSTTGIMGPDGGSDEKPVGTVWIGLSTEKETMAIKQFFGKDRLRNKERTLSAALNTVRSYLLKK